MGHKQALMDHQLLIELLDSSLLGQWGRKKMQMCSSELKRSSLNHHVFIFDPVCCTRVLRMKGSVLWGVTLTRVLRTSGSDSLFFPNFWMLKAAIFMVTVKKKEGT